VLHAIEFAVTVSGTTLQQLTCRHQSGLDLSLREGGPSKVVGMFASSGSNVGYVALMEDEVPVGLFDLTALAAQTAVVPLSIPLKSSPALKVYVKPSSGSGLMSVTLLLA
jgi:hypothetical protein